MNLGIHQRSLLARAKISPRGILCLHSLQIGETTIGAKEQAESTAERLVKRGLLRRRQRGFYELTEIGLSHSHPNVEAWQSATGSAPPLQVEVCRHPPAQPRGG